MDGWFSDQVLNTLQMITFPLEITGLVLAGIEVRLPALAETINAFVVREEDRARVSFGSDIAQLIDPSRGRKITLALVAVAHLILAFLLGSFFFYFIALEACVVIGAYVTFWGSIQLYSFVNHWVPGRTVGTLGLIIAGGGVLGEAYQVAALVVA